MLPNRECLCGNQGQRPERVGEADAERQGCSHTLYSGLFACLIAVRVCASAQHAGGLFARCHCVAMFVYGRVCVHACVCLSSVWKVLLSTG